MACRIVELLLRNLVPTIDLPALLVPFAVRDVLQRDANEPVVFGEGHVGSRSGRGPVKLQLLLRSVRPERRTTFRDLYGNAGLNEIAGFHVRQSAAGQPEKQPTTKTAA